MKIEEVDEPILTKSEILFVLNAIRSKIYTDEELNLFVQTIYKGFEDPYSYDEVYADFLLSYFAVQDEFKSFATESAGQFREQKIFANMFNDRGSDEEYHIGVLEWNISNLQLKLYSDGVDNLEFALTRICKKYQIDVPKILPNDSFEDYLGRVNNNELKQANKTLLQSQDYFEFLICDTDKVEEVVNILTKIDWNFHKLKQ
jgi:hypothetical protein